MIGVGGRSRHRGDGTAYVNVDYAKGVLALRFGVRHDKIESLNPHAVIASHKRPDREDNPRIIEETRKYIRDFDRLAEMTTTAQELYDKMLELHPNRVNPGWALWSSARAAKP